MNDGKLLTISVAAYNVEKYLKLALDSLLIDEILDDIEVFVIDDGGSDNSYTIAKSFEDRFPGTFKVIHKENGGYGSTVNYSIQNATGKYFKLLDGDDWYDKDGLLKLINILKKTDAEAILTQFNKVFANKKSIAITYDENQIGRIINIEDFNFNAAVPMHAITIETEILKDYKLRLPEHMLYTDNVYVAEPFLNVRTLQCENFIVYNYRLGDVGQSVSDASLIKHIDESISISVDLVKFYAKNVTDDLKPKNYIEMNVASTCINAVVGILKIKPSKDTLMMLEDFDNEIKNISYDIYMRMTNLDRNASKVLKIIRMSNYMLYWLFASKV